jgi:hypothetical protein
MAGRRGDEMPLEQLSPYDRLRLALYCYRAVFPEGSRPPGAPTEAYLHSVQQALTEAYRQGVEPPEEICRCCSLELERWMGKALDGENERRRRAGLPLVGEDRHPVSSG